MRPWHILVGAFALLVVIVLGTLGYQTYLAPVPPTPTPTRVPAQAVPINAEGRVVPTRDVALAFEVSGRIESILVEEGDSIDAGQVLAQLDSDQLETQVEAARAAVLAARAQRDMLPEFASEEEQDLAEAQVDQAEANLGAARLRLAHSDLRAPFSGTVISAQAERGEVVSAGTPVIVIADTSRWYVETLDVLEEDAVRLRIGQSAQVEFAAYPDRELIGTVERVALSASTYRGNVAYTIRISLPADAELDLSWGMTAFVEARPLDQTTGALTPAPTLTPSPTSALTATATPAPALTMSPTPGPAPSRTPYQITHTVAEGENLFRISLRYGVTVETIREANDLDDNLIYVGQELLIPTSD